MAEPFHSGIDAECDLVQLQTCTGMQGTQPQQYEKPRLSGHCAIACSQSWMEQNRKWWGYLQAAVILDVQCLFGLRLHWSGRSDAVDLGYLVAYLRLW